MKPTKMGDSLAWELNPYIGTTYDIRATCAALVRAARRLHVLAVEECNGSWWRQLQVAGLSAVRMTTLEELAVADEAKVEREIQRLHMRVLDLVVDLPSTDEGPFQVVVNGDPRGAVVVLLAPDGRRIVVERGRLP